MTLRNCISTAYLFVLNDQLLGCRAPRVYALASDVLKLSTSLRATRNRPRHRARIAHESVLHRCSSCTPVVIAFARQYRQSRHTCAPCPDRKSTRLNSSHLGISYAVFCL